MGLFNWSGKKTEAKLEKITDNVKALEIDHTYPVKILQEEEKPPISAQIISKDYDHLTYIDTDNATYYIEPIEIDAERDANGVLHRRYSPNKAPATFVENELEKRLKELESKLAKTVSLVHNCANCGATLEVEENKPVIHCKYCGSAYIVGTARIYSNY